MRRLFTLASRLYDFICDLTGPEGNGGYFAAKIQQENLKGLIQKMIWLYQSLLSGVWFDSRKILASKNWLRVIGCMNEAALLTLKASGLIICYPNSETMEITINKIFCLNLYVNPLRDTWYSRKYAEPQKDGGQQPRFDHLYGVERRTGGGYTVLSVYCQWLVILQPIRAREIYLLEEINISLESQHQPLSLFISRTQENLVLQSDLHVTHQCISRKTETGNPKPYISNYN